MISVQHCGFRLPTRRRCQHRRLLIFLAVVERVQLADSRFNPAAQRRSVVLMMVVAHRVLVDYRTKSPALLARCKLMMMVLKWYKSAILLLRVIGS